jgi:von Willebrand factor type A domain
MYRLMLMLVTAAITLALCSRPTATHAQETKPPSTFFVVIDVSGSMDDRFPAPVQPVLSDSTKIMDVKRRLGQLVQHLPDETRVVVTAFDHEAQEVCDIVLNSVDARAKLRSAFESIKTRNGSTHLWRTADAQLAKASTIAKQHPESRVRILLYTDGEDMEKAPGLDHKSIIQKYGNILQSSITLDWVTIGFDIKNDVKKALESTGVQFTKGEKAEDLVPLRAGFRLSSDSVSVGETVAIIDDSLGIDVVERVVDWGDKSAYSRGENLRHSYGAPGKYQIRYLIRSRQGKTNQCSRPIAVKQLRPKAFFKVAETSIKLGDEVHFINESSESAVRWEWASNGNVFSKLRNPTLVIDHEKGCRISLTVWDSQSQSDRFEFTLSINKPNAPTANFEIPAKAEPDQVINLLDASSGELIGEGQWLLDGKQLSTSKAASFKAIASKRHVVRRIVSGPGGESYCERVIQVADYVPPIAEFTFGVDRAFLGDEVRVTSHPQGMVQRTLFFVDESQEAIVTSDVKPWFVLKCDHLGEIAVRQVVEGPGGTNEVTKRLTVASRASQPECDFVSEIVASNPGRITYRFVNHSKGTIEGLEFDPGDGSPIETGSSTSSFEHQYLPGRFAPKIVARALEADRFAPSIWSGPTIVVRQPMASWIKNLFWQIPGGLLLTSFLVFGASKIRNKTLERRLMRLSGSMRIRPVHHPKDTKNFRFEGKRCEEIVELDAVTKLSIKAELQDEELRYQVVLFRDDQEFRSIEVAENAESRIGDYLVRYTA